MGYANLFERNSGILSPEQQTLLRTAKILIVGVGGIGSFAAEAFARCGIEHFCLVDFDSFEPSNTNRQIFCNSSTIGMNKAETAKKNLLLINPEIECTAINKLLTLEQINPLIEEADFIFPAADDFALSLELFRKARQMGKPALVVVPSGFWGVTAVQIPQKKSVLDLFGVKRNGESEYLKKAFGSSSYRIRGFFYKKMAGYSSSYFDDFVDGKVSPAQICPTVWALTSIGVSEAVKYITYSKNAVTLPFFYEMTKTSIKKRSYWGFRALTIRIAGKIASFIANSTSAKNQLS